MGPLSDLHGTRQDLLTQVLDQAVPQLNDVLADAGIQLRLLDPMDAPVESGAARRISTGLSLTLTYEGKEQQALVDLINSIPAELKPALGPDPVPGHLPRREPRDRLVAGPGLGQVAGDPALPGDRQPRCR